MGVAATVGAPRAPLEASVIRVEIRAKQFGGTQVLGPVRFDIAAGETVALLGPSGIGKSTLLRIVAGVDRAFDGQITCPDPRAIVFQEPTLLPWRSALDNILIPHPGLGAGQARAALARVGLEGKESAFPGQLSLGQQRRLALARAFAVPPKALLMDEPFVSLDAERAEKMLGLAETLIAEARPATLFVTHAEDEAKRLATRTLHLQGSPAHLRDD